jgi:hypothetical protein
VSFKYLVQLPGESKPSANAVSFRTMTEATDGGNELRRRWFLPTGFIVEESNEIPNYTYDPAIHTRPQRIEES